MKIIVKYWEASSHNGMPNMVVPHDDAYYARMEFGIGFEGMKGEDMYTVLINNLEHKKKTPKWD